jgi:hypothetical protein
MYKRERIEMQMETVQLMLIDRPLIPPQQMVNALWH